MSAADEGCYLVSLILGSMGGSRQAPAPCALLDWPCHGSHGGPQHYGMGPDPDAPRRKETARQKTNSTYIVHTLVSHVRDRRGNQASGSQIDILGAIVTGFVPKRCATTLTKLYNIGNCEDDRSLDIE